MHVSAPGKLMIIGEWAVLDPGNQALVAAINKRIHAEINEADNITRIDLDDYGIHAEGEFDGAEFFMKSKEEELIFAKFAIENSMLYLKDIGIDTKNFYLRSWGDETSAVIDGQRKKLGFGSSAAASVAITAAVLTLHGLDIKDIDAKEVIYKLATISHFCAQGNIGSAFDIAASTYGGMFVYSRFDPKWLIGRLEDGDGIGKIVGKKWPGLSIEKIQPAGGFSIAVGWTRSSSSTGPMIRQAEAFRESAKNSGIYDESIRKIADDASRAIAALRKGNKEEFLQILRDNEKHLAEFGDAVGIPVETDGLRKLASIANKLGAAGKLSGAGGGDCGIAACFDSSVAEAVKREWGRAGIAAIDADLSEEGVAVHL